MSTNRVYNFNPGPSTLPLEVLEEIKAGFMNFGGMSILEISHHSKEFIAIKEETENLIRGLLGVPFGYHVLFLQGGASMQFAMVPLNLMNKTADYVLTGIWSKKACAEACHYGEPKVVFSSEDIGFSRIPLLREIKKNKDASYVHITTNNTIHGTQYWKFPETHDVALVADMSSDILSRDINTSKFDLIYAGAQKNLGPAGVTVVIIRDDLVHRKYREVPNILSYLSHAENKSLYNTPPVFAIYCMLHFLRWVKRQGGVEVMEEANKKKAGLIYDVLDKSKFYKSHVDKTDRSIMNVCFDLPTNELAKTFVLKAKENGMMGLAGHRIRGGIRASIYNAFPVEGVKLLVEFMSEFEKANYDSRLSENRAPATVIPAKAGIQRF